MLLFLLCTLDSLGRLFDRRNYLIIAPRISGFITLLNGSLGVGVVLGVRATTLTPKTTEIPKDPA